jgi:hypothetical protein
MGECIKQKKGSSYCVACVAAMATDSSVGEFRKFVGKSRGPYTDYHLYYYLLNKGYIVGVGLDYEDEDPGDFHANSTLQLEFNIRRFPAYVIVPSETRTGKEHAVYWDGRWIRDPNPKKLDKESVANYKILKWFPITNLNNVDQIDPPNPQ